MPLDSNSRSERLSLMLDDCGAPRARDEGAPRGLDGPRAGPSVPSRMDAHGDEIEPVRPNPSPQDWRDADNLAYIIYTSGSTGTPKGVIIATAGWSTWRGAAAGRSAWAGPPRTTVRLPQLRCVRVRH